MSQKIDPNIHFDIVVKSELEKATSAKDMLMILFKHYNLNAPIGGFTKMIFIASLKSAVTMLKPEVIDTTMNEVTQLLDTKFSHLKIFK